MLYTTLFWSFILVLSIIGYKLITQSFIRKRRRIVFRGLHISNIQEYVSDTISRYDLNDFFKQTSLPISISGYITLRLLILVILAFVIIIYIFVTGNNPILLILIYVLFVFITLPRHTFLGMRTPLSVFVMYLRRNHLKNIRFEISRMITVLKNLIITCKDKPLSAEFIINNLIKFSSFTKPILTKFLSLYRLNRIEEAYSYFVSEIGVKVGREFASLLTKLDEIEPVNLIQQLKLHQEAIRDSYMTERIKRDKLISDLSFIPIIALIFLILLNFVFITFFIDSINSFNILFE